MPTRKPNTGKLQMNRTLIMILALLLTVFFGKDACAGILVANYFDGYVSRYNSETGAFEGIFTSGHLMAGASDLAFGPNGDLFVSDYLKKEIVQYDGTTGVFKKIFAYDNGIGATSRIKFGPTGDLFVCVPTAAQGLDRILKFDGNTGASLGTFASLNGMYPAGLVFDENGDLLVLSGGFGQIRRYDGLTGAFEGVFASIMPGNLQDMIRGPGGDLFVSGGVGGIERFDGKTGASKGFFASGPDLYGPAGMAFDPQGDLLYVSDFGASKITRFSATTGAFVDVLTITRNPDGIVFMPSQNVPEPSTFAIAGFGGLLLLVGARRQHSPRGAEKV